jgi:uncharacterized protein (TIGR03067 family)
MVRQTMLAVVSLVAMMAFTGCSQSPSQAPSPTPSPSPSVLSLVGTWELIKTDGKPVSEADKPFTWEFSDTGVLITYKKEVFKGTYTVDRSQVPNRMTIKIEGQEEGGRGIFQLTDDSFIIKVSEENKEFAKDFEPEAGYDLLELRRK